MVLPLNNLFLQFVLLLWILLWKRIESQDSLIKEYETENKEELTVFMANESTVSVQTINEAVNLVDNFSENTNFNLSTLRYVAVITRHGSRSPITTYPNDPYPFQNSKYWPDGPHELTRYGKQQLYRSGQILRKRYNGFMNEKYLTNDIAIRSNIYDRDFMSAASLLAGLYPPSGYQLWNPYILWQPIPIWEEPYDVATLSSVPTICPRYALEQRMMAEKLNHRTDQYLDLLDYISLHIGRKIDKFTELTLIADTLIMQHENGFKLPEWTKLIYPEPLLHIYSVEFDLLVAGTPMMVRLAAGPILRKINSQLNVKASGNMIPNRLMYIEAGHDVTLKVLLKSFGYDTPFTVETSAFLIFELHENPDGQFVQVLYYNSSVNVIPNILDLPVCPTPCYLEKFNNFVDTIAPDNWIEECQSIKQTKRKI